MAKVTAVHIREKHGRKMVTGFAVRGKNRKRLWSFEVGADENAKIAEKVAELESTRSTVRGG